MQCVSEYPAEPSSYNPKGLILSGIADVVGVSDHSMDDTVVMVCLGAFYRETFYNDRSKGGIDVTSLWKSNEFFQMAKKLRMCAEHVSLMIMRKAIRCRKQKIPKIAFLTKI